MKYIVVSCAKHILGNEPRVDTDVVGYWRASFVLQSRNGDTLE